MLANELFIMSIFTDIQNFKYATNFNSMVKAISRAALIILLLVFISVALWYHVFITIIVLAFCWLAFMLYTDPPDDWT